MEPPRSTATTVGILFIVATGCYMIGQTLYAPIVGAPDYLDLVHPQRTRVMVGILFELVGVIAIPLIALTLYPVLRRENETTALTYVGLRLLEAVPLLFVLTYAWASVAMSREYLDAAAGGGASWELLGSAFQSISHSAFLMSVAIIFPIGAVVLNRSLWRSRLVPRFISGWGLFAAILLLVGSLFDFFGALPAVSQVTLEVTLSGPIAVQEMVLAGWLITKGFARAG